MTDNKNIDPELLHLFAIEARLLDDVANPPRARIDAIYPMTHGAQYERVIMDVVVDLHHKTLKWGRRAAKVLYCGEDAASSFRGAAIWSTYLATGIRPRHRIPVRGAMYIDGGKPLINSFSEARPVLEYMRGNGLTNLELVALPFHITRCFVGFVTEILDMGVDINVFARVTRHISFTEMSVHSQGTQGGTASQFAEAEIQKVLSYKNLTSPSKVLRYLDERDRRIRE